MDRDPQKRLGWIKLYEETRDAGLVCRKCGISRPTLRKWWKRYQDLGIEGLTSQSKRPKNKPSKKVLARQENWILELRRERKLGVRRIQNELERLYNSRGGRRRSRRAATPGPRRRPGAEQPPHQVLLRERQQQVTQGAITQQYGELIQITHTALDQARQADEVLSQQKDNPIAAGLVMQFKELRPLIERVIDQATRRVLQGETVPAQEKVASLWEPHTQIIRRGKPSPHETEFGHKVNYAEVEHGLISDWQIIAQGNPPDAEMLPPLLRQHCQRFGHAPRVLAGDRGLFSPENQRLAHQWGVEQIILPQPGPRTPERIAYEKQSWFRKGLYFRNGIEGRISVVKRTVQLRRCPAHGSEGFERWVGMGILVANMVIIARALYKRRHRKRRDAKVQI